MTPIDTTRLRMRHLEEADAAFLLALLNSPGFLRFIGDRGVRTLEQARNYLREGPIASYAQHGFGMYLVLRREDATSVGLCGLVRRPQLQHPDLGFAFLPEHCARGYGHESANAVLAHARDQLHLTTLAAVVQHDNAASIRLLQRLGMTRHGDVNLSTDGPALRLFQLELGPPAPVR